MKNYWLILVAILLVAYFTTFTLGKCPSTELLYPCACSDDNISCGGREFYNLKLIFELISDALNESDKHFKQFYFNNTEITEIEKNVFLDLTFESIVIENAHNLRLINTHAFIYTNWYVKSFKMISTSYGNITAENNIFDAINGMVNIEFIEIGNTQLTDIPSNAFTVLNKLTILYLHWNSKLKTLGNNSFFELNNLDELAIDVNQISVIPDYALNFRNKGSKKLIIWLTYMPLTNNNSFSSLTFANIKRPFELRFGLNEGIRYLDENIFGTVLSNGNAISFFNGMHLECDCRMNWIYKNKAHYESLVLNSKCTSDGMSLFSDREKFLRCNNS